MSLPGFLFFTQFQLVILLLFLVILIVTTIKLVLSKQTPITPPSPTGASITSVGPDGAPEGDVNFIITDGAGNETPGATDMNGNFNIEIPAGTYKISASDAVGNVFNGEFTVVDGQMVAVAVALRVLIAYFPTYSTKAYTIKTTLSNDIILYFVSNTKITEPDHGYYLQS